jgi:hypothetical protein
MQKFRKIHLPASLEVQIGMPEFSAAVTLSDDMSKED